jgi:hypothetical protein
LLIETVIVRSRHPHPGLLFRVVRKEYQAEISGALAGLDELLPLLGGMITATKPNGNGGRHE